MKSILNFLAILNSLEMISKVIEFEMFRNILEAKLLNTNKKIKEGNGDELWNDKPNKKRHKDIDARWTKKNGETFFGYKNHAKVDGKSKFCM